ncbi:MAG: NADH-quinone oxidoreductase subunit L [Myxococcales bacterium]|nr:NADH-quinone oxidoreductase subunit L [Myxococcales bacterium]
MSSGTLALLCTHAPLVGCFGALVVLRRAPRAAAALNILAMLASLGAALAIFAGSNHQPPTIISLWLSSEGVPISFGFLLDGTNQLMGIIVALIALCIQVYSLGYMKGDPGYARYFGLHGLFAWAMLSFVYSANLLQAFVFWELVGLASFLLIGFWFEKPSAAAAAKKAFVMTRIGDVGMFIGLILLLSSTSTLDIAQLMQASTLASIPDARLTLIALLLFCGVVGKSAQFPLHTWLPDAMEGPTPVSALLHSATMVAAGVFLYARFHPLFVAAEGVSNIVLVIAIITAILAATIAMVQRDMKRVLAYSSISQLAFMLLGLGAGSLYAGVFHLTTHAFFKALLFLCAGAYIHQIGSNDMVTMGRQGAAKLRLVSAGLVIGAAALAGLPPLAGFFSKESILAALHGAHANAFVYGAYLASFLTAYYTFRMVFLVLRPSDKSVLPAEEHEPHPHGDVTGSMKLPIAILTVGAAAAGFAGDFIAKLIGAKALHPTYGEMAPAIGIALAGVIVAFFEFGRKDAAQQGFITRVGALDTLFERKYYLDEIYDKVAGGLVSLIASVSAVVERGVLDGTGDLAGNLTIATGDATARMQSGRLQLYIGSAVLLIVVFCYFVGGY